VSTLLEPPPEAEAPPPLAEDGAELPPPADADELDELDEQAATTDITVPAASTQIAIRAARGRPVVLNRFMRPRILFIQVSNTPRPHRAHVALLTLLCWPRRIVNGIVNELRYRFGLYSPTSTGPGEMLSPQHIVTYAGYPERGPINLPNGKHSAKCFTELKL
jgi:hypothetical protein